MSFSFLINKPIDGPQYQTYTQILVLVAGSIVLSGCAMLRSDPVTQSPIAASTGGGLYPLPMALITIEVKEKGKYKYISEPTIRRVPDPSKIYRLDFLSSVSSDDHYVVERDGNGFLKKVSASADDKTGEIIKTLASTVMTLMTGVPIPDLRAAEEEKTLLVAVIDITNKQEVDALNNKLKKHGLSIESKLVNGDMPTKRLDDDGLSQSSTFAPNDVVSRDSRECSSGVCYRVPLPYVIEVKNIVNREWVTQSIFIVQIENQSPIASVDVRRSLFVKRETTMTFSDGVLVGVDMTKPSELLAFASIPLDLAKAIVGIPAKLVKLRFDQTSADKQLIGARKELIDAQKDAIDSLDKLHKIEKDVGISRNDAELLGKQSNSAGTGRGNEADGD